MIPMPLDELIAELESIRLRIMSLEQFTVPPTAESQARRQVEDLIGLLEMRSP